VGAQAFTLFFYIEYFILFVYYLKASLHDGLALAIVPVLGVFLVWVSNVIVKSIFSVALLFVA
jgi:hypothetical protein